jgi:DNA-binding CsgD family transcriptional regulator
MRVDQLVDLASGPAIATDSDNRVVCWNQAALQLFGCSDKVALVAGRQLHELLSISDVFGNPYRSNGQVFWELATRGEPVNTFELNVLQPEGLALRVSVTAVVVLGPGENEYGVVYLMRPIYRRRRADEVIDRILSMSGHELQRIVGSDDPGERPEQQLTRREIEVLRLLSQGNSSEEIAHTLKVSLHTVRSHVQHVLTKLQAHSKLEAVTKAIQMRLF